MSRKHVMTTIAVAVVAVTALACGSGSSGTKSAVSDGHGTSTKTTAAKTATTAKAGETVTLSSDDLGDKTVIDVTVGKSKQYSREPGEFGSKPDHGTFVVLGVTVVCKKGTYAADPFDFKFVAKDGTVTEGALTVAFKPELDATDLSTGQKVSGNIVFDVSKAALSGGRVQIEGVGLDFDKPAAYWTL